MVFTDNVILNILTSHYGFLGSGCLWRNQMSRPGALARSEACLLALQAAPSLIPTSGTFFHGDFVMKKFLRPSPSSADSRRAVVNY